MAIKVIWGDPQHSTIRLQLGSDWTWEEFDMACEQALAMCSSVPHEVSVAMDIHTSIALTPNILRRMHSENHSSAPTAHHDEVKQRIKASVPHKFAALLRIPG